MKDQPFESDEAMKSFILETVDEISELLKTLQHPKRLEILSLMLKAEIEFGTLMEKTGLPKSALSNHLSELIEKNLIEKLDRGIYRISSDGKEFLSSLSTSYLHAKIREQERLELHRKRYQEIISRYTKYQVEYNKFLVSKSNKRSKTKMKVEIKSHAAFTFVGMYQRGKNGKEFVPQLWGRFFERFDEIKNILKSNIKYGICYDLNKETKEFTFLAACEIEPGTIIPEGMITYTLPEMNYAVVKCTLPTLFDAWDFISEWIAKNGYENINHSYADFEVYPEDYENEETDPMYIYVPVIKAN